MNDVNVRVSRKTKPYTMICNELLQNNNLSFRARGMICYLLSKPNDWKANINELAKAGKKSPKTISNVFKELEVLGYAQLVKYRNDKGHIIGSSWIVYEDSTETTKNRQSEKTDLGKKPTSVKTSSIESKESIQNKEYINNKECVEKNTLPKYLNEIQESKGFEVVDNPDSRLTADIKNKYTSLNDESKKELWNELIKKVWSYSIDKNWIDENYPKRWDVLKMIIKDFVGYHIDKNSFENAFFNYERKLIQWIDKDILKESTNPFSVWNKTKEDIQGNAKLSDEMPKGFDKKYLASCEGQKLTEYKKYLHSQGYTSKYVPTEGVLWFKDHKRVN